MTRPLSGRTGLSDPHSSVHDQAVEEADDQDGDAEADAQTFEILNHCMSQRRWTGA